MASATSPPRPAATPPLQELPPRPAPTIVRGDIRVVRVRHGSTPPWSSSATWQQLPTGLRSVAFAIARPERARGQSTRAEPLPRTLGSGRCRARTPARSSLRGRREAGAGRSESDEEKRKSRRERPLLLQHSPPQQSPVLRCEQPSFFSRRWFLAAVSEGQSVGRGRSTQPTRFTGS